MRDNEKIPTDEIKRKLLGLRNDPKITDRIYLCFAEELANALGDSITPLGFTNQAALIVESFRTCDWRSYPFGQAPIYAGQLEIEYILLHKRIPRLSEQVGTEEFGEAVREVYSEYFGRPTIKGREL